MKRRIAMLTAALMCLSAMPMTGVNAVSDISVSAAVEKSDNIKESELTETVKGDVNADGLFNIADVVLFRKWLVKVPDAKLANWKAADLHEDGKLDVFDFCAMKKKLIQSGAVLKQKITMEDIVELSKKGYDLTWSDFVNYQYEDVGSGLYIYELEVENEHHENIFLLVGGGSLDELPEYIRLSNINFDIRSQEFQELLDWLNSDEPWFSVPEDDETNRSNALKLGKYALAELQKGNYNIDTAIFSSSHASENAHEMMNEEMAELFNESVFYHLRFVDEHTVLLATSYGLQGVQGYLITDGSVEYKAGTTVRVPGSGYDGGVVSIYNSYGDLYYFTAGL